jgi:glycosyltransferase involved in cell wall biosynthesis
LASSSARKGRAKPTARASRGRRPAEATTRLRILFLASQFPFPADNGGAIKTLSVLDHLRQHHEVRLICFQRSTLTPAQDAWAKAFGHVRTVALDRGRNAWTLVRSYLARVPISIERNRSGEMRKLAAESVREWAPDAVFVDGWLMAQYVPDSYTGLRILHEHNAEHELWERQAKLESGARKPLAAREAERVKRYEQAALGRFDVIFAVSEEDRRTLRGLGGDANKIRILANVPDRALLDAPAPAFERTQPLILYLATLSWQPNIEGVERFVSSVFPLVHKRSPEARLVVAGRGASPALRQRVKATEGAEFAGEVEDPEALYESARVFVDATQSGGGTRLKVLNALARGIPVVASGLAAQGLDIVPGEHVLVARNEHAMAEAIVSLLHDAARWKILSQNGRALIRSRYVSEVAFRALDEVLAQTTARP